jgi:hypothetical protein
MRPIPITTRREARPRTYYKYANAYTRRLRRRRKEITRLTPQLLYLVNRVAQTIVDHTDTWTAVKVRNDYFSVVNYYSLAGRRKLLVYGKFKEYDPSNKCPGGAFGFELPVGKKFFFDGDWLSPARTASRRECLKFAMNIEAIVGAFELRQDKIYYALLDAFESLRYTVGST